MLKFLENLFGLYDITKRCYLSTYYYDVERVGKLTGDYQNTDVCGDWIDGRFKKDEEKEDECNL